MFSIMIVIIMIFVFKKLLYVPISKVLDERKTITRSLHDVTHEDKKYIEEKSKD